MPPKKKPSDLYATGRKEVPTTRLTVINAQQETGSIANSLSADRMVAIIRSAEAGNCTEIFRVYLDMLYGCAHLQGEFAKRKLNVLGESPVVKPLDPKAAADVAAAEHAKALVDGTTNWINVCNHLLDAALYPVALVEKVYAPAARGYQLAELVPVPHRLLDFRTGALRVYDVDESGRVLGTSHEADPTRYIVHRGHLLTGPDQFGGPMRSLLWWWLLSTMDRTWWARFLERFGSPFLLGKFDSSDDASRSVLEAAFSLATRIGGLVVTKETDVDIKEAAAAGTGEAYKTFIELCHREMSKLIVGQSVSDGNQASGLGSGVAVAKEAVREDIRKWDALTLGLTIRQQLFRPALNLAGLPGQAPVINWGSITPEEMKGMADLVGSLKTAGLELTDQGVLDFSTKLNLPLQRAAAPAPGLPFLTALSAAELARAGNAQAAGDKVARSAAAGLAQAFRGRYAALQRIIRESKTADECQRLVTEHLSARPPAEVADVLETSLLAFTANAAAG